MNPVFILLIIIGVFALIAITAFAIHKVLSVKLKKDDKPTDEEVLQEEMNNMLEDVKDDKLSKEIQEYKNKDEDED